MSVLSEMPIQIDVVDPQTKKIAEVWRRWFRAAIAAITVAAPVDAQYLVATADPDLSAPRNLGLLASGYLRITTALGIATPSSSATIPASDLTGALPAISGAALTGLSSAQLSDVAAGTYTPTLFNTVNVSASTSYSAQYVRVASTVTVSGRVDVDPTGAGAVTLGVSLPIASNLGAASDCAGCGAAPGIAGQSAAVVGDVANDRATLQWIAVDVTNQALYFSFTYRVI